LRPLLAGLEALISLITNFFLPNPTSKLVTVSLSANSLKCQFLDLNPLAATNLIELHIAGQEFCNPAVFKTFLESVGPNLRCLSLGGSNLPEFTICELVGLLPHLEKLDLRYHITILNMCRLLVYAIFS